MTIIKLLQNERRRNTHSGLSWTRPNYESILWLSLASILFVSFFPSSGQPIRTISCSYHPNTKILAQSTDFFGAGSSKKASATKQKEDVSREKNYTVLTRSRLEWSSHLVGYYKLNFSIPATWI
jgi:hypothetical protein